MAGTTSTIKSSVCISCRTIVYIDESAIVLGDLLQIDMDRSQILTSSPAVTRFSTLLMIICYERRIAYSWPTSIRTARIHR